MRACSVEMAAAPCWSSQKPGSPIFASSSAARVARRSGSKVITDPVELGPDLLQALGKRGGVGHAAMVPGQLADMSGVRRRTCPRGTPAIAGDRPTNSERAGRTCPQKPWPVSDAGHGLVDRLRLLAGEAEARPRRVDRGDLEVDQAPVHRVTADERLV